MQAIKCPSCGRVPTFLRGVFLNGERVPDGVSLSCACEVLTITPPPMDPGRRLSKREAIRSWNFCIPRWKAEGEEVES
jgi:hypothetical protein